jgi:hypothetical protein
MICSGIFEAFCGEIDCPYIPTYIEWTGCWTKYAWHACHVSTYIEPGRVSDACRPAGHITYHTDSEALLQGGAERFPHDLFPGT